MAEANYGISGLGREVILYRKQINDVIYFRPELPVDAPPLYVGYLSLGIGFGEGGDTRIYEITGKKVWGQWVALYPPYESRLATNNYCLTMYWRTPGISWTLNTY